MSGTSFIVEVPTLFTKSTQMAMRSGNTILTGNERIEGNMVINGSLTLDGTIDDTLVQFDDFDISSLNVYEDTTLNILRVTSTLVVEDSSTLNGTLSVVGHSSMTGLSCDDLEVGGEALMNNVQVSGTMNLANGIVDDLLCQQNLEVVGVASFFGISMESLDVSGHSNLESISCETLEVLGDLSVNVAFLNDVSCLQLDISNTLNVVGEAIFRDISVGGDVNVGGSISHKNDFAHFYIETDQGLSGSYYKIKNFLDGSLTGNAIRIDSSGGTTDNDLFVAQKTGYFKINGVFSYFNTTGTHRLSVRTQLYKNNSYANGNSEGYDYLQMVEGDYGSNVLNSIIHLTLGDSISVVASMNRGSGEGFSDDTNHLNLKSASVVFEYIGE